MRHTLKNWSWIPSLYFTEGLPYVMVMTISVIMYKRLGISNTDIALYTSWLYLPWVIKPFWSPFVDLLKTKRWWIIAMQLLMTIGFACIAFTLPTTLFFQLTLAFFWLVAFTSATHDIAADGFYMLALDEHDQSFFVGIRSTFYRLATVAGQGLLVILAGFFEKTTGSIPTAWLIVFVILSAFFLIVSLYHSWALPHAERDMPSTVDGRSDQKPTVTDIANGFADTITSFFTKKHIIPALLFMLLFRLPEAQLVKLLNPFLLDPMQKGGLGLSTGEVGLVYGTIGILGLTIGGIVGGIAVSRSGLRKWIWPMTAAITLPDLAYVYLAYTQPDNLYIINACVFIEQFGYGFGFTAYMLYLMYFSEGSRQTSHYAICTGFMALGMMLPGMGAGWLQEQLGYRLFFVFAMVCCLVTAIVTFFVRRTIDPQYGIKQ